MPAGNAYLPDTLITSCLGLAYVLIFETIFPKPGVTFLLRIPLGTFSVLILLWTCLQSLCYRTLEKSQVCMETHPYSPKHIFSHVFGRAINTLSPLQRPLMMFGASHMQIVSDLTTAHNKNDKTNTFAESYCMYSCIFA